MCSIPLSVGLEYTTVYLVYLKVWIKLLHRLITIQIEHNNPEAAAQRSYTHAALDEKTEREHACNCNAVIVNEKFLNSEKTTSSVLYVSLLIYYCLKL